MTDGEFPFRSFTLRSDGYDNDEVDTYIGELQTEITELRRALETATPSGGSHADTRLHDPEGAVTRTLAIAQETADRVLHDSQVEADRRRAEADEHATSVIAEADERAWLNVTKQWPSSPMCDECVMTCVPKRWSSRPPSIPIAVRPVKRQTPLRRPLPDR